MEEKTCSGTMLVRIGQLVLPMVRCEGRENLFLISASLRPRTGVSTVTAKALYPAFSARRTRSKVTLRSCSGVVERVRKERCCQVLSIAIR
jgi:hypothetical protein